MPHDGCIKLMKKSIISFCSVFLFFAFATLSFFAPTAKAEAANVFLPSDISISVLAGKKAQDISFDAGTTQNVRIGYTADLTHPGTIFEYGVAKEIKKGYLTYYEILNSDQISAESVKDSFDIKIPNIATTSATTTYVAYLKTFVKGDPDTERFFATKSFGIKANTTPFINVKYSNLLQSTGKRVVAVSGPSIYNPQKESAPNLATSTSLEVTFESNQETVLRPVVEFTKLRSTDFSKTINLDEIKIKKGETYAKISLPVFDYVPGVYVGKVSFGSSLIENKIDLQYIVGGESATVGTVAYEDTKQGSLFSFNIFGTPIDLDRIEEKKNTTSNSVHTVTLDYSYDGKPVYSETKDVDFSTTTFSSLVPSNITKMDNVTLKVVSKADGSVLYQGSKDLFVLKKESINWQFGVAIGILIVMIIIFLFTRRNKTAAAVTMVLIIFTMGFARASLAWEPTNYVTSTANSSFFNEGVAENPRLYFSENLSTKQYACGDDLSFSYKISYIYCSNTGLSITAGFSKQSAAQAESSATAQGATAITSDSFGNGGNHTIYRNTTAFVTANLGSVSSATNNLYAYIAHDIGAPSNRVSDGFTKYTIPLRNCSSDSLTIGAQTSTRCGGGVDLSWNRVASATRYDIYRSDSVSGNYVLIGKTTNTTYTDMVGTYSTRYYYKVKSFNSSTNTYSDFSNPSQAVTSVSVAQCLPNTGTPDGGGGGGQLASCGADQKYCQSSESCIAKDATCRNACGAPIVPAGGGLFESSLNMCASGFEPVVGSVFARPSTNKWYWTCRPAGSTGSGTQCESSCPEGTFYEGSKGYCATDCPDWCPNVEGDQTEVTQYIRDDNGHCLTDGKIKSFYAKPDTAEANCPAFWDTVVGAGAVMKCSIGGVAVPATNPEIAGAAGRQVQAGKVHTLSCDIRLKEDDTLIKTVTAATRCFKIGGIIEN